MFNSYREKQFAIYNKMHSYFVMNFQALIDLEQYLTKLLYDTIQLHIDEIILDYNEASYLYPFWQNYPPDERGRQPIGDQYPWIEVGEHVFGPKLSRILSQNFEIRDCGIPTGPDERFVLKSEKIKEICRITDSCWLFIDIKSVGPRDDQKHTVMSHNQISGNGKWTQQDKGILNDIMIAKGKSASHPFYSAIPPIYILSNETILPVVHIVIKPVYKMLHLNANHKGQGQPLNKISLISIPNGILLTENPNYLKTYPGLLFPGKDDKGKDPRKMRARISFEILQKINDWRVQTHIIP